MILLEKIEELRPHVVKKLEESALPVYSQVYDEAASLGSDSHPDGIRWSFEEGAAEKGFSPPPRKVRKALEDWARRVNLLEPWVLDVGLRTLESWHRGFRIPPDRGDLLAVQGVTRVPEELGLPGLLETPFFATDLSPLPPMRVPLLTWIPTSESEEEFKSRAVEAFKETLEEYLAGVRDWAGKLVQEGVLEPTKGHRSRRGEDPFNHLEWFVRFQVPPTDTEREIANSTEPVIRIRTVRDALAKVEELTGVTRRST